MKTLVQDVKLTDNINLINIIGTLSKEVTHSHMFDNKMFYFFEVEVISAKTNRVDTIQVFVPEDMIIIEGKIIEEGTTIDIKGKLVHSKVKGKSDVAVLADKLEVVSSDTAHVNQLYVAGKISKSYDMIKLDGGKVSKNIIIKHTDKDGRYFNLKVSSWNGLAKKVDSNYKVDDDIIIRGRFESKEQDESGESINLHRALATVVLDGKSVNG